MARRLRKMLVAGAAIASVCLVVAPAVPVEAAPIRTIAAVNSLEVQVLGQVNQVRAQHGLAPLRFSARLAAAADQHSRQMARVGYFSHSSADGSSFWKRVQRYYASNGYGFWSVGENLLWSSPDVDAAGALKMWMNSAAHRANLLDSHWREVGLSAVHVTAAPGSYRGLDVTIVTADFGVRH